MLETCLITVTRNADISFDEEKFEDNEEDFRKQVLKLLKKRGRLAVVRLELNQEVSDPFFTCLTKLVQVDPEQCFVDSCPLQMGYIFPLAGALSHGKAKRLSYPALSLPLAGGSGAGEGDHPPDPAAGSAAVLPL